jgi:hypothetical protein
MSLHRKPLVVVVGCCPSHMMRVNNTVGCCVDLARKADT